MSANHHSTLFAAAIEQYAAHGVDVEDAIAKARALPISLHCWQGDDVGGFEKAGASLEGGGIQVTGSFPGKARNIDELRADIERVKSLIPGTMRLSLHAIYGDFHGAKVDRDELEPAHFSTWIDWAAATRIPLDFNATFFSHPLAASGLTLSHPDASVRAFWIEHAKRARKVAAAFGAAQGSPSMHNLWIPDGSKDKTGERRAARERLIAALDAVYAESYDPATLEDAVEGKLFGIGAEYFTVGSNDFYLGYAATRKLFLTLDMGHFHPTESVADKISAVLPFVRGILLHLSRGVRWDSDHVLIQSDELADVASEVVRCTDGDPGAPSARIKVALDYFDGSIDRIGAWAIGARAARKAFLYALLEPRQMVAEAERAGDGFARLALFEEEKSLPWGAVWEELCRRDGVPTDAEFIAEVHTYAREVLARRH